MFRVVVFAEDEDDAEIVCGLADRVFREVGNIPSTELTTCRSWQGDGVNCHFIKKDWIPVKFEALKQKDKRPRFRRRLGDKPPGSYTAFWRKAIELVVALNETQPVRGVLIHCDVDHKKRAERKDIEQACGEPQEAALTFVLATPDREIEAWLLNGFCAQTPAEEKRLAEWKRKLQFDPCTQAERARDTSGDRDPKNIINALTNSDAQRKRYCWEEEKLGILRQRGVETLLTQFLDDVETRFLDLLTNKESFT